jgi:DNA-directed RNA polymerase subunit RPC12/RpoP
MECKKCGSKNLDYRSNYEWGEEYNEDNEDNIIQCDDCNNEWEEVIK